MRQKRSRFLKTLVLSAIVLSIVLGSMVPQSVYAEELPSPNGQGFKYLYTLMHPYDHEWGFINEAKYEPIDVLVDSISVSGQTVITMSNITDMPEADCTVGVALIEMVPHLSTCERCHATLSNSNEQRCRLCKLENKNYRPSKDIEIDFGGMYGKPIINRTISFSLPEGYYAKVVFSIHYGGTYYSACTILNDGRMLLDNYDDDTRGVYKPGTYTSYVATIYNAYDISGETSITNEFIFAVDRLGNQVVTTTVQEENKTPTIDISAVFSAEEYATLNPDLASAGITSEEQLRNHFLLCGMKEGRVAKKDFNLAVYKAKNPDLVSAFGDDNASYYMHYINCGHAENRVAK